MFHANATLPSPPPPSLQDLWPGRPIIDLLVRWPRSEPRLFPRLLLDESNTPRHPGRATQRNGEEGRGRERPRKSKPRDTQPSRASALDSRSRASELRPDKPPE